MGKKLSNCVGFIPREGGIWDQSWAKACEDGDGIGAAEGPLKTEKEVRENIHYLRRHYQFWINHGVYGGGCMMKV